ncbi:MAG TPA: hypothetical protein VFL86_00430 [Burkholderiaceae bacterium]|nr:hypothetical protein [Burkholderiaceae bacterium]
MPMPCTQLAHLTGAAAVALLALVACGGDGNEAPPPAASKTDAGRASVDGTGSLQGVVIAAGALQGATVCLDLDANGACDATDPASAATDAQGAYTITGLSAEQLASGAPLLAVVPATAVDAAHPGTSVGTAYALAAPAGKGGRISAITHLVRTGVAGGLTLAEAEATVAAQLQVSTASLYNDYTGATGGDNLVFSWVAPVLVASLQAAMPAIVRPAASSAASYSVRQFKFTDAGNYALRYFYSPNVPDAAGRFTFYDERVTVSGGVPVPASTLYDSAIYLTASGAWVNKTSATPNVNTAGSPNITLHGNGYGYAGAHMELDVSGHSTASVVSRIQDLSAGNTFSSVLGVDPATLTGTMPAGARLRIIISRSTVSPVGYRVSDGSVSGVTTLTGLISAYPVPATPTPSNTVSMGNLHGTAACGQVVCPQERLRAAFGPANAVALYLCDLNTQTNTQSNCTPAGSGVYERGVASDGSTPVMRFPGMPAVQQVQTFTRVFIQRNGRVWLGWVDKPTEDTHMRLNRVAFEALAAELGITPPAIGAAPSPFAGTWAATYAGSDSGSCGSVFVDANGAATGGCTSSVSGQSFVVWGPVQASGAASLAATLAAGTAFDGTLAATTASGTWATGAGAGGTWTATKRN